MKKAVGPKEILGGKERRATFSGRRDSEIRDSEISILRYSESLGFRAASGYLQSAIVCRRSSLAISNACYTYLSRSPYYTYYTYIHAHYTFVFNPKRAPQRREARANLTRCRDPEIGCPGSPTFRVACCDPGPPFQDPRLRGPSCDRRVAIDDRYSWVVA